ncbi:pre-mRNA-splicing factor cwc2 [Penicillium taxi]|uniref:pre-mRNA-splicing factor cwc2 n=1 Tax=Penicillium taxi TaxID=168475 RepID=UPI0025450CBB|nr:pre-mRNA-splicing factor cwc2 [Penicillium taxi]KAJ5908409.1 pre-mRNA-splicing factor cwc2 [Penicillium taxi]
MATSTEPVLDATQSDEQQLQRQPVQGGASQDDEQQLQLQPVQGGGSPTDQQLQEPPKKKKTKLIRRKKTPARVQVDQEFIKTLAPEQTGTTYNLWYNRFEGGNRGDNFGVNTPAPRRCVIAEDSGYTMGDKNASSFFCIWFARGTCPKGSDCEYLHRLPGPYDMPLPTMDCFGRDKFQDYRSDMGGVGTFNKQNRTLYVGKIHVTDDIEEVVARHFAEWGQVERIRVLTGRGVAFVTYMNEVNAQFAKEAMSRQSLANKEILNVRWATEDPNPAAQKREAQRLEEQAAEAIRRALPADFIAELEGRDPEAKRRRKIEGSHGLQGYEVPDNVWHAQTRQLEGPASAPGQPGQLRQLTAAEQGESIHPANAPAQAAGPPELEWLPHWPPYFQNSTYSREFMHRYNTQKDANNVLRDRLIAAGSIGLIPGSQPQPRDPSKPQKTCLVDYSDDSE